MKRFTILAAFLLFATIGVMAQSADTTVVINNHEVKIKDNENGIKIKIYDLKDGVRTSDEPVYESNYSKRTSRSKRFTYSYDGEEFVLRDHGQRDEEKSTGKAYRELEQALPIFYLSHLEFTDGPFGVISPIHQRPSSFEWGLYSPTTIFCTKGGHFGMATGLGISNSYNYFQHDYVLAKTDNGLEMLTLSDYTDGRFTEASKSYLRYWSLRVPLTLQLQWRVGGSPLTVSAGAEVEWRFGMRSFARYDGAKRTITNDLKYNAFGCNALVQVGYAGFIIFGKVGLVDVLSIYNVGSVNQLSVGIGFNFD